MVDDEVGHDIASLRQVADIVPVAEPGIDLCVVSGIEAGVRAVERLEERQNVHAAEEPGQRPVQQLGQTLDRAPSRSA